MKERVSALGLDIGRRRIGVAGCDGLGLMATGLMTLDRRSSDAVLAELQRIVNDRQVQILVIGLPLTMDGELSVQARQIQKFARRLEKALQLPVEFVDERFTSAEAEELIQAGGRSPSRNKAVIDRKAAAIILQRWLDARRKFPTQR